MFTNFVSELNNDLLFTIDEKFLKNLKITISKLKLKLKSEHLKANFLH